MKNGAQFPFGAITEDLPRGSLNRAAILLRVIAQGSRKGSSLCQLVARTGLPRPTIHRTLDMLAEIGWVYRDPETMLYNLGLSLAALGYTAITRHAIERIAAIHLNELAAILNQVVYLGVRTGLDHTCIGRYESEATVTEGRGRAGLRYPLGLTPSCMAILARLPPHEIEQVVTLNLSRYHRIEGFEETGFRKAVAKAVKQGYSTYDGIILDRSTSGLGVAICDHTGYPLAGIGTTFATGKLTRPQWNACLYQMQKAAQMIAHALDQSASNV
ncbi:helix-turn-helix domain-containing protein [Methylobacillus arboreus]|uniref:IclR family transcriptional regulator n=1 Tax=Methylobacillus arboreus TaxID=755170 RepID=UPI001E4B1FFE|nr:helix-turn-helix domain-containing protein [Methylobacillus arboreus]MCB5190906.1 helix-turn-helix domain-containing protein [Methylobacillus arboreus]